VDDGPSDHWMRPASLPLLEAPDSGHKLLPKLPTSSKHFRRTKPQGLSWQRPIKQLYIPVLIPGNGAFLSQFLPVKAGLPKPIQLCGPLRIIVHASDHFDRLFPFHHRPSVLQPSFLSVQLSDLPSEVHFLGLHEHELHLGSWQQALILRD
jgi:hypothetical protein